MNEILFPVVILAGGLATRLHPMTHTLPKSLIEINDEPFIAHQLRLLKKNGIQRVVLCVGYLGEKIIDFVGNGNSFGLQVAYSLDGPHLLGTAGSIQNAMPLLPDSFFVLYGDSYLSCPYLEIQKTFLVSQKKALMAVFHNKGEGDQSNVEFHAGSILAHDKKQQTARMHHIDYGLGVFNKSVFASVLQNTPSDLTNLYQELIQQQQLAAFEVKERFYEVGSFAGINEFKHYLLNQNAGF